MSTEENDTRILVEVTMLHALISNPERYKYITNIKNSKGEFCTNQERTDKNINKATLLADALIKSQKARGLLK